MHVRVVVLMALTVELFFNVMYVECNQNYGLFIVKMRLLLFMVFCNAGLMEVD